MKGIKFKAVLAGRKFALLGAAIAVAGLGVLGGAGVANAALGTQPGTVTLNPSSGSLGTVPTWSTTIACPSTANASAKLLLVGPDGVTLTAFSANINGASTPLTNEPTVAGASVGALETNAGYSAGATAELIVQCYSGASGTGTAVPYMDAWLTFNTDNATYTLSSTPPAGPVTPSVALSVQPNPVQVNSQVTLTATVMAGSTPVTTGTVQFESGSTSSPSLIGTPVSLSSSGVATTQTTFTSANSALPVFAAYQTANSNTFSNATSSAVNVNVTTANPNSGSELITVTVPPSGSFQFTTPSSATVPLTVSGSTATGALSTVTVADSRTGLAANSSVPSLVNGFSGFPGWSVVGQSTNFSNPTSNPVGTIPATGFNWTPTTPASGDFTLGSASTSGLSTAQTLASAATGHGDGTFTLGANLSLAIPTSAPAGAYSSTLTLTANPTANFS